MRAALIINPAARGVSHLPPSVDPVEMLAREGVQAEVRETKAPGHATALAVEAVRDGVEAVIVCAGDGTVREAIDGLAHTDVALGIIPGGTGNVLARDLGLPLDLRRACRAIAQAWVREVDLGEVNGLRFVLHASAGGSAEVVSRVTPHLKSRLGQFAFVWIGVRVASKRFHWEVNVETDEQTWRGCVWDVIVGNAATFAWKLKATPRAKMDDGVLDVCILHATGPMRLVGLHARALMGLRVRPKEVTNMRARHVHIHAEPPAPVQADGDLLGRTPAEIKVLPRALRLLAPQPPVHATRVAT
ncbi:MAG: diacylglycerol/lipid kinase family protein [Armatimonadota bacterium]